MPQSSPATILSIDTSGANCVVVLSIIGSKKSYESKYEVDAKRHSPLLLPFINELLGSQNLTVSDLSAIVLSAGPGSFIGVRMAAALVQGLAFASNIPVYTISSLHVLAQSAYMLGEGDHLCVHRDAHMGDSYIGYYQTDCGLVKAVKPDMACKSSEFKGPDAGFVLASNTILPEALHVLACSTFENGEALAPSDALPVYLRGNSLWKRIDEQH